MKHDLRCAIRAIWSHRWFSAAVVVTLALGIGLNTMVFTLINAVLFKPVPVPGGARLVAIANQNLSQPDQHLRVSYLDFLEFRAQSRSFESLQAATDEGGVLSEPGNPPQSYHLEHASTGIFSMLQTEPVLGRDFRTSDELAGAEPVLVLLLLPRSPNGVHRNRLVRARSTISSPRPFNMARIMYKLKSTI